MSSIGDTINRINAAIVSIVIAVSFINLALGAIGLVFNVIIFTRPSLHNEPCSLYFFSSTCFNLFVILVIVPIRIASEGFNTDITSYNIGICKLEFFVFYVVRTIPCWLIVLACVDRYLKSSTKVHIRRLSSLRTAKIAIYFIVVLFIILHIHMPIYYEITYTFDGYGNLIPACYGQAGFYRKFIAFWSMVFYSLCPSLLMILFGMLTVRNIHQSRRIRSEVTSRRIDRQLACMLTAQVLAIVLSTLPFSVYRLYASFTASLPKDATRLAWENLAFKIANVLTYFAHSTSFYLYTLTGTIFRKELVKIVR
ncbi:unnamed protein product [Adineta ricciae]|uniref:G-protein coupled receptors family 1 profile domain-containing protein n=1 Tax=Adineta ricciae TaxID=249248 RepID=A0A814NA32_ADIRI|nr:unnamed protein product [Adineta ricciae]CAF1373936.1 unnamed protein product [Adineta ricciae]